MPPALNGKRVTVMGLGLHGGAVGTVEWLVQQGAQVLVTDRRSANELKPTLDVLARWPAISYVLGEHRDEDFTTVDMVIRNPAVPRSSPFLQKARAAGVPVEMDSSLFFRYCPSRQVIGVTGSKGKTTTTNAIAILFKVLHPQTVAVGIEGTSPLGELPTIRAGTPVIFELSSWRLEGMDEHQMSPATAVVTSIYRDHLNTYASYEEYIETKKVIFKYQQPADRVLLNADDPVIATWDTAVSSQLFWYSMKPLLPGQQGIAVEREMITVYANGTRTKLFSANALPLPSEHERRNILPGIFLAFMAGGTAAVIESQARLIAALPHRLEVVRELNKVMYINDSAATMPDATIAALKALGDRPLVLILGGSDKELLFESLAQQLANSLLRAVIWLPGTATAAMKKAISPGIAASTSEYDAATMSEAIRRAYQVAQPGDRVLLSPGATSFGLFQHEFDRGNQFRSGVLALH